MSLGYILLGGSVLAAIVAQAGKVAKTATNLQIGVSSFKIDKKQTSLKNGLVGNLTISIYNPGDKNVVYEKFVGNLFHNNQRVGNIDPGSSGSIVLTKRQTSLVPLKVKLPLSFFGNSIVDILKAVLDGNFSNYSKVVKLSGFIKLQGLPNYEIQETFNIADYLKI